ncbi:MAG TPA: hypothetical protein VF699_14025 [Caulobacteraceae bacterium]|jgi:hypothetical protein
MTSDNPTATRLASSCWICPPYGAPSATSEVSRIAGFYRVSAAFAFLGPQPAPAAQAA